MTTITKTNRISDTERLAWIEWLERLGIDPGDVAVPGRIVRDLEQRRVCWITYQRDENGQPKAYEYELLRDYVYVQLESVPPPFPTEAIHATPFENSPLDVLSIVWHTS